jgi:3-methyladenine DNA glycosylase/8-oxoguanine DNA glycosylase
VDAIVEQQISIKVARSIEDKIAKKLGGRLEVNGETYHAFPTPRNLKDASISDIRECGLSQRKAEYIYGAAELIVNGKLDLEKMKNPGVCRGLPIIRFFNPVWQLCITAAFGRIDLYL